MPIEFSENWCIIDIDFNTEFSQCEFHRKGKK